MDKHLGYSPKYKTHLTNEIIAEKEGEEALISGWVIAHRNKGKIIFIKIRDGSGIAQIVVKKGEVSQQLWDKVQDLPLETVIRIRGKIVADSRSQTGAELKPEEIDIIAPSEPLPIDLTSKKTQVLIDTIFEYRQLSIRRPEVIAVMKIKHHVANAVREFYTKHGFYEIWTPMILGASTEGGAEMFKVDYFSKPAVLAQSCQFYKQAAIAPFEKVFGIIPSWRAEKSRTPKHVTEFHQIETEIAFGTDKTIMEVQEQLVHHVIKHVVENCQSELKTLGRQNLKIPTLPLKRLEFSEAKKIATKLVKEQQNFDEPDGDLSTPAETALSKEYEDPFFIIHFPSELRGIYYESDPDNEDITLSLDLIAPEGIGELSSGGVRVTDPEKLIRRIKAKGYNVESFKWYIDMFRYGGAPHAGFGLGFERLVRWITGVSHIREAIMFPRTPDLLEP